MLRRLPFKVRLPFLKILNCNEASSRWCMVAEGSQVAACFCLSSSWAHEWLDSRVLEKRLHTNVEGVLAYSWLQERTPHWFPEKVALAAYDGDSSNRF